MFSYVRAILWAQIRTFRNFYPRGNFTRLAVTSAAATLWYAMWTFGAVAAGIALSGATDPERLRLILSRGLMAALFYWQLIPILMVSSGASLDLKRLRCYPVPRNQLFGLEVLLRLTTGVEMLLLIAGASAGLLANPTMPAWAPLGFISFVLMNLFLSAGLRNLLERVLARKYVREIGFLLLVSLAALPQVLLLSGIPTPVRRLVTAAPQPWWPWSAATGAVLGSGGVLPWIIATGWMLMAYSFGRWQFEKGLNFDSSTADVRATTAGPLARLADRFLRLPSLIFSDPIGVLIEKELRTLSRSPRFRVVFVMGFTFGLLIWLPVVIRGKTEGMSFFSENYLTFVSLYALLLLGEVSFWNSFGFDRSASQAYFLFGGNITSVLIAKNITAVVVVWLEVSAVALACFLLRMPVTLGDLAESYLVTLVLALYMLAAGNIGSTRYPRPVDPRQSWRSSAAGRFQAMLLLIYPVISLPVILAFLARYAFDSDLAFFGVLAFAAILGSTVYWFALQSAISTLQGGRERFLAALCATEGPLST